MLRLDLLPRDRDKLHTRYDHDAIRELSRLNERPMAFEGRFVHAIYTIWRPRRRIGPVARCIGACARFVRYAYELGHPAMGPFPGFYFIVSEQEWPRYMTWAWQVVFLAIQAAVYERLGRFLMRVYA